MDNEMPSTSEALIETKPKHAGKIKAVCAILTTACFGWGCRAAWRQARPMDPKDLNHTKLMGGVGFASRALGIATLLTCSGFALLVLGVSAALDVNTPRQFGTRMRAVFGDRFRIKNSGSGENYESLSELFEAASKPSEKSKTTEEQQK